MKPIHVATSIAKPCDQVWASVRDISSHVDWMHDAADITFTSEQTEGVGTEFDCLTVFGPIRLVDTMTITEWEEARRMGVRHTGLVTGEGVFELSPVGRDRTVFSWTESLQFPLLLGGPVGAFMARPIMTAVWKRNLRNLRDLCERADDIVT